MPLTTPGEEDNWWAHGPMHNPPCQEEDCYSCAASQCPGNEPLHFHHDGCPHCYYRFAPNNA
jgi:hypothetical protein